MATIYDIKPSFQKLLRPLVRRLAGRGVTANQVTVAALALSLLTGGLIAVYATQPKILLLLPIVLFIRIALNAIDGMLAREHRMQSALGAILNELSDVISDAALYLPFALLPDLSPALIVLIVIAAVMTEMAGVAAVQIGASRRYDGPMGKSDRAFVFGLAALLLGIGATPASWLNAFFVAVAVLTLLTVANRARQALKEVSR